MVSDEALLRQVHQGDEEAMSALVGRYHARLNAFIYRYTQDRHLSEDLVQEAFLRIIRARDSAPEKFAPWLFRIAINLCRDHAKSAYQRREQPTESRQFEWREADNGGDPAAAAERSEIRAAVATLAGGQREILLLHYFGGWTLQEVATILELPLGTVKSRLWSALKLLKASLADPAGKGGDPNGQPKLATISRDKCG